ncbi:hypothetical protein ACIGDI_05140 [Streptomyces sp. NPDC085900]
MLGTDRRSLGADLSLRTASKGGDTLSTTVRKEHHCDLWDRLAAG